MIPAPIRAVLESFAGLNPDEIRARVLALSEAVMEMAEGEERSA